MAKISPTRLLMVVALCAVVICSLVSMPSPLSASQEEKPDLPEPRSTSQPCPIAVIDVATVLENMPQFRSDQMALRADVERARSHFQERQNALVQQQQELQKASPDAPDYKEKIKQSSNYNSRSFSTGSANFCWGCTSKWNAPSRKSLGSEDWSSYFVLVGNLPAAPPKSC